MGVVRPSMKLRAIDSSRGNGSCEVTGRIECPFATAEILLCDFPSRYSRLYVSDSNSPKATQDDLQAQSNTIPALVRNFEL